MIENFLASIGFDNPLWLMAAVAAILVVSVILGLVFNKLIFPIVLRLAQWLPSSLDSRILNAARLPLTFGVVVLGVYLAVTLLLELAENQLGFINVVTNSLAIIIGIWVIAAVVSEAFRWYIETIAPR